MVSAPVANADIGYEHVAWQSRLPTHDAGSVICCALGAVLPVESASDGHAGGRPAQQEFPSADDCTFHASGPSDEHGRLVSCEVPHANCSGAETLGEVDMRRA